MLIKYNRRNRNKERIGIFVGNFDLMFIIFFFRIVERIINLNFI